MWRSTLPFAVVMLAGCATVEPPPRVEEAPAPVVVSGVVQDERGVFVFCGPDCPQPTPKLVAIAPLPALRLDPPPPPPPPPEKNSITLHVRFALASSRLSASARATLDGAKQDLLAAVMVRITGMTDAIGGVKINRRLAQARAQAVRRHLMAMGVPSQRIEIGIDCCAGNPPVTNPPYRQARIELL
jgi:outer membrane protein OmpA-like peptidoglycan-associated protein